jgi:hypothetical protein
MCSCTQISRRVSLSTSGITISLTFNQEWVSGDRAAIAEWSYGVDSSDNVAIAYHKVWRQEQLPFAEINQQTEYGNWYYAVENKSSLTHRSGADTVTRQQFAASGSLDGATDKNYRFCFRPRFGFYWVVCCLYLDPTQSASERCSAVPGREGGTSCTFSLDQLLLG